jgi:hypothetical protein
MIPITKRAQLLGLLRFEFVDPDLSSIVMIICLGRTVLSHSMQQILGGNVGIEGNYTTALSTTLVSSRQGT